MAPNGCGRSRPVGWDAAGSVPWLSRDMAACMSHDRFLIAGASDASAMFSKDWGREGAGRLPDNGNASGGLSRAIAATGHKRQRRSRRHLGMYRRSLPSP